MTTGEHNSELDRTLDLLKTAITQNLDARQQRLIMEWLKLYSVYLGREETFDPLTDTLKYEAGTIVSVELGYNPGSEHGGNHYAVVIEDNTKSSPVIMVVPLGSAKPGKAIHRNDVDLGEIPEINVLSRYPAGTKSVATISQMRAVSKLRIKAPVRSGDQVIMVSVPRMRQLYGKIKTRYTSKGLNREV